MKFFIIATSLVSIVTAQAGAAQASTDPASGIAFQSFTDSRSGAKFGFALSDKPSQDFIGHISGNAGTGWAGSDLGPNMVGKLLLVAWPNGAQVVSSVRLAVAKANPGEYPNAKMLPIAKGTFARADAWQLTFLCKGCLANATVGFDTAAQGNQFGWAVSSTPPADKASSNSVLNFHADGYGSYAASLSAAKSNQFGAWAAMAASSA